MDYVTVKSDILNILATNPSLTNLGRSLSAKQPDLHAWVMTNPPALPDEAGFNERLFCIANDIETRPQCPFTGTVLKFINFSKGYRKITKAAMSVSAVGDVAEDFSAGEIFDLADNAMKIIESVSTFKASNPVLFKKVMSIPDFGDARFTERLYAVVNDICVRPDATFKSFPLGYSNSGATREDIRDASNIDLARRVGSECPRHGSKVKKFLRMNADRNAALYDLPDDRENIDFVVCPVLGIRTLNIKKLYIEGVLLMTEWEFEAHFPDQQRSCSGHSARISEGLAQEIDGVTRHATAMQNAKKVRRLVGKDGLTSNQRIGVNTRRTHMENIDENGLNGYQRIAAKSRSKQITTLHSKGMCAHPTNKNLWKKYRYFVDWISAIYKERILDGKPTGLMGSKDTFQVDHIFPVIQGFNMGVDPWIIAHPDNLCCLKWEENASKTRLVDKKDLDALLERTRSDHDISNLYFEAFCFAVERHGCGSSGAILEKINETYPELRRQYPLRDTFPDWMGNL
jgi:hypothetical protein